MSPTLSSPNDRDPSGDPKPDYLVSVIVPEEFTGVSMGQLQTHAGMIKEMEVKSGTVVIQALIPEREFAELASAISEWTQERGKVEHHPDVK
jgi:translation elongation factor EF-G